MKRCPECGNRVYGRSDKRFCTDACRSAYHNRENKEKLRFVHHVNTTLYNNRRLLLSELEKGRRKVSRESLKRAGFNFDFHTFTKLTSSGRLYRFCYEVGYLELTEERLAIVKLDSGDLI